MKFKKGDLVIMTDYGIQYFYDELDPYLKEKRRLLYRVRTIINENIYIDSMDDIEYISSYSVKNFRLATSHEIKLFTIKNILFKTRDLY